MSINKYCYKAATVSGEVVTGEVAAASQKTAANMLQQRGMTPLRIQPVDGTPEPVNKSNRERTKGLSVGLPRSKSSTRILGQFSRFNRRTATTRDLVTFSQDLSSLLEAGVPLLRGLKIISDLVEKKKFRAVILGLHEQIKEGSTFWQALEKYPTVFTPVFVNMVKAGEVGGILDVILTRLGSYLDGVQELKEYLFSAMMYPLFLLLTAAGSVTVLLAVVIPKFAGMFSDMGVALPLATQIMLVVGTFLQSYWWLLAIFFLLLFFLARFYVATPSGRYTTDRLKLRIPVLGSLLNKIEISRFCRTFGTLLNGGIPILSALQMVEGVLSNVVLCAAISDIHLQLKQGESLSESLGKANFFPPMAVQMIAIGEETGRMDSMLTRIATMYDREIKVNIKTFTSLFEPLIILLMGLVIGAMVISMLLAIFSVNDLGF